MAPLWPALKYALEITTFTQIQADLPLNSGPQRNTQTAGLCSDLQTGGDLHSIKLARMYWYFLLIDCCSHTFGRHDGVSHNIIFLNTTGPLHADTAVPTPENMWYKSSCRIQEVDNGATYNFGKFLVDSKNGKIQEILCPVFYTVLIIIPNCLSF